VEYRSHAQSGLSMAMKRWLGEGVISHRSRPDGERGSMMTVRSAAFMLLLWMMLIAGGASIGIAGEQRGGLLKQYWGKITAIRVDRCGKRPGLCEGVIILTQREGGDVTLAIRPGTWITRAEHPMLIEELSIGNEVHVQAVEIAGEGGLRATTIEGSTRP
jgi:hypothetical protein